MLEKIRNTESDEPESEDAEIEGKNETAIQKSIVSQPNNKLAVNPPDQTTSASDQALAKRPQTQFYDSDKEEERAFEQGERNIGDEVTPDSIQFFPDKFIVDGNVFSRVLFLSTLPPEAEVGWTEKIYGDGPGTTVISVEPYADRTAQRILTRRETMISHAINDRKKNRKNPNSDHEVQIAEVQDLKKAISRREQHLYKVGTTTRIEAESLDELDDRTTTLNTNLGNIGAHMRNPHWRQDEGYKTVLPIGYDGLKERRNLPTSALTTFFPLSKRGIVADEGIIYGRTLTLPEQLVAVDAHTRDFPNGNMAFIAESGAGKSSTLKVLALRHVLAGYDVIVIDPARRSKHEYMLACEVADGDYYTFGPGSQLRYNMLTIVSPPVDENDPLQAEFKSPYRTHKATILDAFSQILPDQPRNFTPEEQFVLNRALDRLYQEKGIFEDPESHKDKPMPKLPDLAALLEEIAGKGDPILAERGDGKSYKALALDYSLRVQNLIDGPNGELFAEETNFKIKSRFTVLDLSTVSDNFLPLAYFLTGKASWEHLQQSDRETVLIADEIQDAMRVGVARKFFGNVAEQIRKNKGIFWYATQRLGNLTQYDEGNVMLANSFLQLWLGQNDIGMKELRQFYDVTAAEMPYLAMGEGEENKGRGIFVVGSGEYTGLRIPIYVERSPAEELASSTTQREIDQLTRALMAQKQYEPKAEITASAKNLRRILD